MCAKYFIKLLKEELRDNIRLGILDIHIIDGMLIVDINTIYNTSFRYTDDKIMDEILIGKSVKEKAFEILKMYKSYLLSHFFTQKFINKC